MASPVSSIRNLGPASEAEYGRAGISSAEQLREMGPDAAYAQLIRQGIRPHFIGYYALVMGLQGRPWTDCRGQEKANLRKRFDAICKDARNTGEAPSPRLAAELNRIGVRLD